MSKPNHANLNVIQRFFQAYAAKDLAAIRETLSSDIIWRIPGRHPLSGSKHGVEEVVAFFDQLGKAKFQATPIAVAVDGDYVLDYHRGWTEAGNGLDLMWTLVFKFKDGKIADVTNFCSDQHLADEFFQSQY